MPFSARERKEGRGTLAEMNERFGGTAPSKYVRVFANPSRIPSRDVVAETSRHYAALRLSAAGGGEGGRVVSAFVPHFICIDSISVGKIKRIHLAFFSRHRCVFCIGRFAAERTNEPTDEPSSLGLARAIDRARSTAHL